jgi:hypothetical protein
VQNIDRLVKLIFGAILRGHCATLLVGAEIEIVEDIVPTADAA